MLRFTKRIQPVYLITDLLFFLLSLFLFCFHGLGGISGNICVFERYFSDYLIIFIIWPVLIYFIFQKFNLYSTDRSISIPVELTKVFWGILLSSTLIIYLTYLLQFVFLPPKEFVYFCFTLFSLFEGWRVVKRLVLRNLILKGFHNINILLVGANTSMHIFIDEIKRMPWMGFRISGYVDERSSAEFIDVPFLGKISDFNSIIKRNFIDEVIVADSIDGTTIEQIFKSSRGLPVAIRVIPESSNKIFPVLDVHRFGVIPLLTYKITVISPVALFVKRFSDLFISLFALLVFFPVFLIIVVFIKFNSQGSILFKQRRVGLRGKEFTLFKFRSMVESAEALKPSLIDRNEVKGGVIFKMKNDPRITSVGKFLRRYSLDELPQLFNVLKGDMSLVGPRPPTIDEVMQYKDQHMERLSVKPGITGLAQIKGRSDLTFTKWARWDSWYINNWSLGLDFKILLNTVPIVLNGKGSY